MLYRISLLLNLRVIYPRLCAYTGIKTNQFNLSPDEELTFIHPDDVELYNAWDSRAFELQVANHELLGHGSGKLFQESADGKKNFDPEKVCCEPFPMVWRRILGIKLIKSFFIFGTINRSSTP